MKLFGILKFIFKSIALGLVAGFLVLFFMPNSKMPFNWHTAKEAWHFYQVQKTQPQNQFQSDAFSIEDISFSSAVEKAFPSVVSINAFRPKGVRGRTFNADERILDVGVGIGSGVILDATAGYIVTNYHVVANAEQISINLSDGRKRFSEIVGYDIQTDLAVLKTDLSGLTAAQIADPASVDVGDLVMAIGSPFGQNQSVSLGIVSAITFSGFDTRIQNDAAINSGNSGGALINTRGELIGINHSKLNVGGSLAQSGVNFAIPVDTVQEIVKKIIKHGRVQRNWSGIEAVELNQIDHERMFPDIPFKTGFFVNKVSPNSPAYESGVLPKDFITGFEGQDVTGIKSFYQIFTELPIGKETEIIIIRQGRELTLKMKLREQKKES